jgi:hypothetical protein
VNSQRSYSLSSYSIVATYENDTDVTSAIIKDDDVVLGLESSRVAGPGEYQATYSFTNEDNGTHPIDGWTTVGGYTDPTIVDMLAGHSMIVDVSGSRVTHSMSSITDGYIEFWIYIDPAPVARTFFELFDHTTRVLWIRTSIAGSSVTLYVNTPSTNDALSTISVSRWYRLGLVMNTTTDCMIDDEIVRRHVPCSRTDSVTVSGSGVYLDAIGISSDGYVIGTNRLAKKQFTLSASFGFSLSIIPVIEEVVSVDLVIDCVVDDGISPYSILFVQYNGTRYKAIDLSDKIATDGTTIRLTIGQYKYFLIQPGISIIMTNDSDTMTSVTIDYLSLIVSVMI